MSAGPRRDLSALTSRSDALKGSLVLPVTPSVPPSVKPTPQPATPAPLETTSSQDTAQPGRQQSVAEAPFRRTRKPQVPRSTGDGSASGGKRSVIVYLPAKLLDALKEQKGRDTTYTEWVLDAFDEHYDQLGQVFISPAQRRSPLPPKRRGRRRHVDTPTSVQLRFAPDEFEPFEARRLELQVDSRSEFVTKIVELGLGKTGTS